MSVDVPTNQYNQKYCIESEIFITLIVIKLVTSSFSKNITITNAPYHINKYIITFIMARNSTSMSFARGPFFHSINIT